MHTDRNLMRMGQNFIEVNHNFYKFEMNSNFKTWLATISIKFHHMIILFGATDSADEISRDLSRLRATPTFHHAVTPWLASEEPPLITGEFASYHGLELNFSWIEGGHSGNRWFVGKNDIYFTKSLCFPTFTFLLSCRAADLGFI